jgi:hypothetical protein
MRYSVATASLGRDGERGHRCLSPSLRIFLKSYGYADRAKRIPNTPDTRFHIASLSIMFTTTAILRLIDQGKLTLDTRVSDIIAGIPHGELITISNLLEQNSGMADANDLPNYDALLAVHQTPQSLIDAIKGTDPESLPGGARQHEEHSAQNLLALVIERKTGLSFKQAMRREVFEPFGMHDSGINEIVHGNQLSLRSRREILNANQGYGWDARTQSKRLGTEIDLIGGRCCGFSSILLYVPDRDLCIVAMANIEHDANPFIIQYLAAMMLEKPYPQFAYNPTPQPGIDAPINFEFGKDFYRPSATLRLVPDANGLNLQWPDHPYAGLVPTAKDEFMDRYYGPR